MQRRKTIKYVGFYDFPRSNSNRVSHLAATNKMDYVCSAIVRAGYNVEIISPSWMGKESRKRQERQNTVKIDDNISVTFCPSWRTRRRITGYVKIIFSLIWLFLYLLVNARRDEKILVYHSPWLSTPIRWAKFWKRFKIVLEVEEIYSDVWKDSRAFKFLAGMENRLVESADILIVSCERLKERFKNKQSIILYGGYLTDTEAGNRANKERKKIELLYAGAIDDIRGGAYNAVMAMEYLPDCYCLNIIGFGAQDAVDKLNSLISGVRNGGNCRYCGVKTGKEYSEFLYNCDIALNPQYQGDYMDTGFPSKILSYLSHNLHVVSTKIRNVEVSALGSLITFSACDSPKSIADAIMSIDLSKPYDSISRIKELDKQFVREIGELLEG